MLNPDVVIVQPLVPSYRNSFFKRMSEKVKIKIYTYRSEKYLTSRGFHPSRIKAEHLKNIKIGKAIFVNVFPLLLGTHKVMVLCAENKILSNWVLLLFARYFNKKIILWGHGVDARNYSEESEKMPFYRKLMYFLADGAWFYTDNEKKIWQYLLPNLKSIGLVNTIDLPRLNFRSLDQIRERKRKYNILTPINFIYCARFNNKRRRSDLLVKFIESLDSEKFGLIVIGSGEFKPNFQKFRNVYEFGSVYDHEIKSELFSISDAYFQPAWTGLSIVEAMAYGKGILTLERSEKIAQCVEYGYIQNGFNGMVFKSIEKLIDYVDKCKVQDLHSLGCHARTYYEQNLRMEDMVRNALRGISLVENL